MGKRGQDGWAQFTAFLPPRTHLLGLHRVEGLLHWRLCLPGDVQPVGVARQLGDGVLLHLEVGVAALGAAAGRWKGRNNGGVIAVNKSLI